MARNHLFAERHRTPAGGGRRQGRLALQPRHVVVEQTAVLDDAPRDFALTLGEGRERDLLAAADLGDDREIGGRQDAQVLAILPIDALDVLGDDELDPGAHLGVGRLLAR